VGNRNLRNLCGKVQTRWKSISEYADRKEHDKPPSILVSILAIALAVKGVNVTVVKGDMVWRDKAGGDIVYRDQSVNNYASEEW
jgi:hypothetical protein